MSEGCRLHAWSTRWLVLALALLALLAFPSHVYCRFVAKTRKPRPEIRSIEPKTWAKLEPYTDTGKPAYTTMVRPSPGFRVYRNLYYQNMRWYAVLEPGSVDSAGVEEGLTSYSALIKLPIADLDNFTKGVANRVSANLCI